MAIEEGPGESTGVPEYLRVDRQGRCWWCGQSADSREHKYKRSDAVREFGRDAWNGPIVRVAHDGKEQIIQGPNSQRLKFSKTLCQRCNNARSQPFDEAYDEMMEYLSTNEAAIIERQWFKFSDVYRSNWRTKRTQVLSFLIKHIGCRLAQEHFEVPQTFTAFLDGRRRRPAGVAVLLNIRLDIVEMETFLKEENAEASGSLWLGEIHVRHSLETRRLTYASSHSGVGPIRFSYEVFFNNRRPMTNLARNRVQVPLLRNVPAGVLSATWVEDEEPI